MVRHRIDGSDRPFLEERVMSPVFVEPVQMHCTGVVEPFC